MEAIWTTKEGEAMKTAAAYCRVSTSDQEREGTSLDSQKEACLLKASELGYDVPEEYIFQEVWTGAETDRPQLNELRELVKRQLIDAVICLSTDRLARNPIHIAIIAEECDRREIELHFITEPLDSSPEGALIRYVKGYAAQIEREKIRERSIRGKKAKAREGKMSTGGSKLFGYYYKNGKREINHNEAQIAISIFEKMATGRYTLYRLEGELNDMEIAPPGSGKWTVAKLSRLLNNPAYKGDTYVFRFMAVKPKNPIKQTSYRKTSFKERDFSEWIHLPNATPAIVSAELYDAVQNVLLGNRAKSKRNRKYNYLLSNGRLRCGICGHTMTGYSSGYGERLYYICTRNTKRKLYGGCPQPTIRIENIERLVWSEVAEILENPDIVLGELERQRKEALPATIEAEEILLSRNIEDAKNEERRYLRQYGRGSIDEHQLDQEVDRIRRYRAREEAKLAQLAEQKKALEEVDVRYSKVSDVIGVLANKLANADNELKHLALEALDIRASIGPSGEVQLSGTIPTDVELNHACSLPQVLIALNLTTPI